MAPLLGKLTSGCVMRLAEASAGLSGAGAVAGAEPEAELRRLQRAAQQLLGPQQAVLHHTRRVRAEGQAPGGQGGSQAARQRQGRADSYPSASLLVPQLLLARELVRQEEGGLEEGGGRNQLLWELGPGYVSALLDLFLLEGR